MNLQKRISYMSKSILSVLPTDHLPPKSKPLSNQYTIPSSILIIICVISIWAIVFYFFLGLCYVFRSGVLIRDLNFTHLHKQKTIELFKEEINRQFHQLAMNCFISVFLYLLLFVICLLMLHNRNKKKKQSY